MIHATCVCLSVRAGVGGWVIGCGSGEIAKALWVRLAFGWSSRPTLSMCAFDIRDKTFTETSFRSCASSAIVCDFNVWQESDCMKCFSIFPSFATSDSLSLSPSPHLRAPHSLLLSLSLSRGRKAKQGKEINHPHRAETPSERQRRRRSPTLANGSNARLDLRPGESAVHQHYLALSPLSCHSRESCDDADDP